jgi:streptogramin lyase
VLHGFNDIALGQDGTVYVTDSPTHAVYKLAPGGKQLELLLRDSRMTFPNGIVLAADGRTLYVAHVEGISALDPTTRSRSLLPVPADGSVNSIDGLLLHDGVLYGVQNSPYMHRIVGAALGTDGRSIMRVWTINSRTPAEYLQTTAAIAGENLYMVGGRPMPDAYGGTNPARPVRKIWRVPLKQSLSRWP